MLSFETKNTIAKEFLNEIHDINSIAIYIGAGVGNEFTGPANSK